MSSIPLPALAARAPQSDPLEQLARVAQLKAAQQQLQGGQLENQSRQLQIQQQQIALRDSQIFSQASKQSNGDVDQTIKLASQGGMSPAGLADLLKLKQASLTLGDQQRARAKANLDALNSAHQQLAALGPMGDPAAQQKRAAAYPTILNDLQQMGVDVSQMPQQYPGDQQADDFGAHLQFYDNVLAQNKTKSEIGKNQAQEREATAKAVQAEQQNQYGGTPQMQESRYRSILQKAASGQPLTAEETTFAKGFEASQAKSTTTSDSLGVTSSNTSRPAGLASVTRRVSTGGTPAASENGNLKESLVDQIGQYKMDPQLMGRALYRHPELLGMLAQKYPEWDQTRYQAKNKILQSYTSGPESRSINAISTALGHAGELGDAIAALNNGDIGIKTLRAIGNRLGIETGGDAVTTFNTIVHRLAPEITAAYVQGGGGEGERVAAADDFNAALGGKQLRNNLAITVKLLRSKIAAQEQQWNTTYQPTSPKDDFATRFLTPQAKSTLNKWSPESQSPASSPQSQANDPFAQFGGKSR